MQIEKEKKQPSDINASRLAPSPRERAGVRLFGIGFQGQLSVIIVILVLIVDQVTKVLVKTNMYWRDSIRITDWFYIYFTENNGMAFGMEIFGKLFLTTFRIIAVGFIIYYLAKFIKSKLYKTGVIVCGSLILAGAIGNIIDSVFYGVIFSESTTSTVATFMPEGGGYSTWFYGKVVDMLYFPIIDTYWPEWMPFVGGEHFIFFSPIFNIADTAISCGIIALILFYGKYLNENFKLHSEKAEKENEKSAE